MSAHDEWMAEAERLEIDIRLARVEAEHVAAEMRAAP